MKNQIVCLAVCVSLSFATWGQQPETKVPAQAPSAKSDTKVSLQRNIKLERDSKSEEVILPIEDDVDVFKLIVTSSVTAGNLKIEVYDPEGNRQGTYSVGTQLNARKPEHVNGNINKALKDPQTGNWKVNIVPAEATGTVTIQTSLYY